MMDYKKYKDINVMFGIILRRFREGRDMSQSDFAEMCQISRAYYGRIERGEHSATVEMCGRIAEALGISLADLFQDL